MALLHTNVSGLYLNISDSELDYTKIEKNISI